MVEIRAHSPRELQPERKVSGGVSPFRGGKKCFSRALHIDGCRRRLILRSIPTIWKIEPRKQTITPQGKPCLIKFI